MWTSKLSHIRVKRNHWCSVKWINFNSWESKRSTGSTLPQYTFPIGQLKFIISWCTKNKICCVFAMWMTSFIVWGYVVRIWFLKLELIQLFYFRVNYLLYLSWFLIVSVATHLTIPGNTLKCYKWNNHTSLCGDLSLGVVEEVLNNKVLCHSCV